MITCYYYWLIEPLRSEFIDNKQKKSAFDVPIKFKDYIYILSLYIDKKNMPEYAKLTIPNLQRKEIPNFLLPLIQSVKEHLLSVLRLNFYSEISLFPRPIWMFNENDKDYKTHLKLLTSLNLNFDANGISNFFKMSFPFREEIRLLIDGLDLRIPLQYRYLSLYKILELHFKHNNKWKKDYFSSFIKTHDSLFKKYNILNSSKEIHSLRDKCAHIKTGKKKETFGVTHLNHKEAVAVEKMIPLLKDLCIDIINKRAKKSFTIKEFKTENNL